jgi:hypothetical protein
VGNLELKFWKRLKVGRGREHWARRQGEWGLRQAGCSCDVAEGWRRTQKEQKISLALGMLGLAFFHGSPNIETFLLKWSKLRASWLPMVAFAPVCQHVSGWDEAVKKAVLKLMSYFGSFAMSYGGRFVKKCIFENLKQVFQRVGNASWPKPEALPSAAPGGSTVLEAAAAFFFSGAWWPSLSRLSPINYANNLFCCIFITVLYSISLVASIRQKSNLACGAGA